MTTATRTPTLAPPRWLLGLSAWQIVYAIAAVGATVMVITGTGLEVGGTLKWVAATIFGGAGVMAAISVPWLLRRDHRGRLTAFLLAFLLAIGAYFIALQEVNFFNGLDAVGEAFPKGIPFLALTAVGWLVSGWAAKLPRVERSLRLAARWMMGIGFGLMLIAIGLFPGLWEFAKRIVQPGALVWAVVGSAAAAWAVYLWRDSAGSFFGSTRDQIETLQGFVFVAPNIIGFLAFLAGPLAFSLFVSFTDWDGLGEATWLGLQNYIDLFTDPFFLKSLRNILIFGAVAVPLSVAPALALAALLNRPLPGMKLFRALFFIPAVAGVVGVALIWKQLYNATVGFINYGILQLYELINFLPGIELAAPQPLWLSSTATALLSMIIVFSFQTIGFNAVLFLAGIQSVPNSLYEAADIDGAGQWAKFRRITVPMLAPTTVFVVITTTILALQLFSEPFILMAPQLPPNGPNNATLTPVIYLYQNAFQRFNQGYASAIGWVLFLLIFVITLIYFRTQKEEGVLSA